MRELLAAVMASLGGLESFVVSFGIGAMAMLSLVVAAKDRCNGAGGPLGKTLRSVVNVISMSLAL